MEVIRDMLTTMSFEPLTCLFYMVFSITMILAKKPFLEYHGTSRGVIVLWARKVYLVERL